MSKETEKKMDENPSDNDQIIRTVPGTDVGGHDTAGTDGEIRTERPGAILGTPNGQPGQRTIDNREQTLAQSDFITQEVDRTNREVLPRLGGESELSRWEAEEGGVPEFLDDSKPAKAAKAKAPAKVAAKPAKAAPASSFAPRAATPAEEAGLAREREAGR